MSETLARSPQPYPAWVNRTITPASVFCLPFSSPKPAAPASATTSPVAHTVAGAPMKPPPSPLLRGREQATWLPCGADGLGFFHPFTESWEDVLPEHLNGLQHPLVRDRLGLHN